MKKIFILLALVFGSMLSTICRDCANGVNIGEKFCGQGIETEQRASENRAGVIGPRWTYGIMVKNVGDKEIRVRADGGDVDGYIAIPAGQEKLLNSRGDGKRGVYWRVGNFEYATAKYAKPDYIIIKNGNFYTMTSMDGSKNMGTWMAIEPVSYDGKAEIKKIK